MDLKRKLSRLGSAGPGSRVGVVPRGAGGPRLLETAVADGGVERAGGDRAGVARMGLERAGAADAVAEAPSPSADLRYEEHRQRLASLRENLERLSAQHRQRAARAKPAAPALKAGGLPGAVRHTPHGPVQMVEVQLEPEHQHGDVPVNSALRADPIDLAALALDEALLKVDPHRLLLLDTETTGLMGGTGTLPFLIGMAWFHQGSLRLQQLILRQPGEEGPMLALLAERIAQASCVVTFNGKSYDWPLLRNRFVMNRVRIPEAPPHLDLLHCARRVYKRRLDGVRLVHVEEEVLGFTREDDIPGAHIPERYFAFLRGAPGQCLQPIVEHNASDLIALAAILGRLAEHYGRVDPQRDDPRDRLCMAELALRGKDAQRALRFAQAAAEQGRDDALAVEALALCGRIHKREGNHRCAADCWEEALGLVRHPQLAAPLHLELAKLYEHQLRDLPVAQWHAERAAPAQEPAAAQRRIERLRQRIARLGGVDRAGASANGGDTVEMDTAERGSTRGDTPPCAAS